MKVGLFFGSFNPIHNGHLVIAEFMATQTDLEEVWFVVSPHNPLKNKKSLANDYDRLAWVQDAIADNLNLKASSIEFNLPQPSFTIVTLSVLKEKFPDKKFHLIMGGDSLLSLPKWKNADILMRDFPIYVYTRPEYDTTPLEDNQNIRIFKEVPQMNISASYIRNCLRENLSIRYLVPDVVFNAISLSSNFKNV
jgi:nicotinate-nucleotide adenylyltransferase